jgi:hypothetical protein
MVEEHEAKIRRELLRPHPDEALVAHWQKEIEVRKEQVVHLTRRLKRDW